MDPLILLAASFRLWTPLVFAAMGGVVSERAGVVNIALEGMMLAGAYASVAATVATGSPVAGVAAGAAVGAVVGLLHAVFTLALRVPHILSGVGINLGAVGLTTFLFRLNAGGLDTDRRLPAEAMVAVAVAAVALLYFVFAKTPLGLRIRAAGENPSAARSAGIHVLRLRYGAVVAAGVLAGVGGAALALTGLGTFTENMTAGRGYIALAAVIFGRWSPLGAAGAALFFSVGEALQQGLQTAGLGAAIPPDFVTLLPYVLTLAALAFVGNKSSAPAALGGEE